MTSYAVETREDKINAYYRDMFPATGADWLEARNLMAASRVQNVTPDLNRLAVLMRAYAGNIASYVKDVKTAEYLEKVYLSERSRIVLQELKAVNFAGVFNYVNSEPLLWRWIRSRSPELSTTLDEIQAQCEPFFSNPGIASFPANQTGAYCAWCVYQLGLYTSIQEAQSRLIASIGNVGSDTFWRADYFGSGRDEGINANSFGAFMAANELFKALQAKLTGATAEARPFVILSLPMTGVMVPARELAAFFAEFEQASYEVMNPSNAQANTFVTMGGNVYYDRRPWVKVGFEYMDYGDAGQLALWSGQWGKANPAGVVPSPLIETVPRPPDGVDERAAFYNPGVPAPVPAPVPSGTLVMVPAPAPTPVSTPVTTPVRPIKGSSSVKGSLP